MKTSLQTFLVIGILGFLTNPAASMESRNSSTNAAMLLDGVISRNVASSLTIVETNAQKIEQIDSINLSSETTNSLLETDTALESFLKFTRESSGEPITNSAQINLIQF